jgi:hypothetical protein
MAEYAVSGCFLLHSTGNASFSIFVHLSGREEEGTKGEHVVCKNLSANAVSGWKKAIKNWNYPHGFDKFRMAYWL